MDFVKLALESSGFKELNPLQKLALKKGLLKGKNLVVFAPTASGKTLIAEIAALKTILEKKLKVIYLTPLVALASEKYEDFKKKYSKLGIKVAISVGQFDSADPWLKNYDWIVVTNEKMESLIRHRAEWINDIGLVVADEVHLLNDPSRGPTLEVLLTLLKKIVPKAQFLLLSATISNANEIAEWMNANVVYSEWRPVKLYRGVLYGNKVRIHGFKEKIKLRKDLESIEAIIEWVLKKRKQALIFVSTRKKSESLAERISKFVSNFIGRADKEFLKKIAEEIENVLEVPTRQCKREAKIVKRGVAFHHAGLLFKQKRTIEENFRRGLIRVIVATPTLCYGLNLPSFLVLVKDTKRYYPGIGYVYLPVLEVQQMEGRAGRPAYDEFGISLLYAKSEEEADLLEQNYIFGKPERIRSKLSVEPILRSTTLALISIDFCNSIKALFEFFSKTFFAFQFGDIYLIEEKIREIIKQLLDWGFVEKKNSKLYATRIGRRVSELYLDPLTAHKFILGLKNCLKVKPTPFTFLHLISFCREMRPLPTLRSGEYYEYSELVEKRREEFAVEIPEEWEDEYEDFLMSVKNAKILESWIEEMTEDELLSNFGITPGELWSKLQISDWLLYSLHELALLLRMKKLLKEIKKVRVRVHYGVREELLPLVKLEGVGRVRARKLFNSGIKTISDLRKIPLLSLERIVGPKIARKLKQQVEKEVKEVQKTLMGP